MKSDTPKVLFDINDQPLCFPPFAALFPLCDRLAVVVGYRGGDVRETLLKRAQEAFGENEVSAKTRFCTQDPPAGTGDAVRVAVESFAKQMNPDDEVIVVNGDLPLLRRETLESFVRRAREMKLTSACLTMMTKKNKGLGRIVRGFTGAFEAIREERDASEDEKRIREVNGGVYYFRASRLLDKLSSLKTDNAQGEFYLTDLLGNKGDAGEFPSEALPAINRFDLYGVNTTFELASVRKLSQTRLVKHLCEELGVDFDDPSTVYVSARAKFEGACRIGPGTKILGPSVIGKNVLIEGQCYVDSAKLDDGAYLHWCSVVRESRVGPAAHIGPMAHLRPGSDVGAESKVGNFVELKKTKLAARVKASHLTYLGDADVGPDANIGCGTITCNYDGFNKYPTKIGARAFIGSDTQLIAPVNIGEDAYIGSGTTVTGDVPNGALALSRMEMTLKPGYAERLSSRLKEKQKK